MNTISPPPVHRVIVAQLVAAPVVAAAFLAFSGLAGAWSALLGGGVSVAANGYFVALAFRYRGARDADKVVRSFMRGELGKLGITVVLFGLCLTLIPEVHEPALVAGFAVTYITGVLMSGRM